MVLIPMSFGKLEPHWIAVCFPKTGDEVGSSPILIFRGIFSSVCAPTFENVVDVYYEGVGP